MNEDNIELLLHEVSELRKVLSKHDKKTQKMLLQELEQIKQAAGLNRKQSLLLNEFNRKGLEIYEKLDRLKAEIGSIDTSKAEKCLEEFKNIKIPSPDLKEAEKFRIKLQKDFSKKPAPIGLVKFMIGMFLVIIFLIMTNFRHQRKIALLSTHRLLFIDFVNSKKPIQSEFFKWYGDVDTTSGYRPVMIKADYVEDKYDWYKGWFGEPK